jgi:hypothetical protein
MSPESLSFNSSAIARLENADSVRAKAATIPIKAGRADWKYFMVNSSESGTGIDRFGEICAKSVLLP